MNTMIAALILVLGLVLLGSAAAALLRGGFWINPKRFKSQRRRLHPGGWIARDRAPFEFWLGVGLYALVGAAAIAMAVTWLRK